MKYWYFVTDCIHGNFLNIQMRIFTFYAPREKRQNKKDKKKKNTLLGFMIFLVGYFDIVIWK